VENITVAGFFITSISFFGCTILIRHKNNLNDKFSPRLIRLGYMLGIWSLLLAFESWLHLGGIKLDVHRFVELSSILFISILMLDYSCAFLDVHTSNKVWILVGISAWILVLFFNSSLFKESPLFASGEWSVSPTVLASFSAIAGGFLITTRNIQIISLAFGSASHPSRKNLLIYGILCLSIIILSYVFFLFGQALIGIFLCLVSYSILVYLDVSANPVDLIHMGSQSLRYMVIALLTVGVYTAGFLIAEEILSEMRVAQPVLTALLLAAVFVLILNPVVGWVAHKINNLVFGVDINPSIVVRNYSQGIGNVVDLKVLKQTSLGMMYQTFGVNNGNLYLVDKVIEDGYSYYRLSPIRSEDSSDESVIEGRLSTVSPVSVNINQLKRPLLQYELDSSADYKSLPRSEREWLLLQSAEVYVPIITKYRWVGLFVLGAKTSGEKFSEDDLILLSTLADQTAVALENARLFSSLTSVNRELQLAQVDLEMANQQLREIDDLKSSFIRVVTHELRTPLANMAFSLQILRMYGPQKWSADQVEQVQQIENNLHLARIMVDNLITFAGFLNKQIELNLEMLDFKQVTIDTMIPIKQVAEAKAIDLQIYFVGDLQPVRADRKLLGDAVYQLIHNAVKFTPQKGRVWVTCWTAVGLLYFDVKDTGIGVPRDRLKSLWEGFTQVSDSEMRGQEGLGLGLALVRFIVAAHGGKVWAESGEGEGSTFGFRIPLAGPDSIIDPMRVVQGGQDITRPARK
jgi:signal transduction histidine kinase